MLYNYFEFFPVANFSTEIDAFHGRILMEFNGITDG